MIAGACNRSSANLMLLKNHSKYCTNRWIRIVNIGKTLPSGRCELFLQCV